MTSDNEMTLSREVTYLQGRLEDITREKDYITVQLEKERGVWKRKVRHWITAGGH